MNTAIIPETREETSTGNYGPAVSVILPFEPKMCLKSGLLQSLHTAAGKVEQLINDNYGGELGALVIQKMAAIFQHLNFNTYKKSIAVYVSPLFEKILYLDFAVEEKIIVEGSFEIRDLVYSKKQVHNYLVLLLSGKQSLIFVGNSSTLVRIVSNTAESLCCTSDKERDKKTDYPTGPDKKDGSANKFLYHIDNVLDIILKAYQLPLFVLADGNTMGHFKELTKHSGAVIEYVQGNFEEIAMAKLKDILAPQITDWVKVKQKNLMNLLEAAAKKKKLAVGIRDVWHDATSQKGNLLVVEENYRYVTKQEGSEADDYVTEPCSKFSYIKDVVDDVMEKVLENGGDVEFVAEGVLKNYHRIALIQ